MIRTFTQDDLLRYVYHETSEQETSEIEQALLCDADLQLKFKEMCMVINALDVAKCSPSDRVVDNILNYSKSLHLPPNK